MENRNVGLFSHLGRSSLGFTLIELLIVVAIIGMLIALMLPAVQSAREAARWAQCANNMKQVAIGLTLYHDTYQIFPGAMDPAHLQNHNYMVRVLPFVEHLDLYEQYDLNLKWNHPHNRPISQGHLGNISVQLCPSSEHISDAQGDYAAIIGTGTYAHKRGPRDYIRSGWPKGYSYELGVMVPINGKPVSGSQGTKGNHASRIQDVTDGLSYTIILGEAAGRKRIARYWANGDNTFAQQYPLNRTPEDEMASDHPGGLNIALADGSVRFLSETTSLRIVDFLATRAMGEIIDEEF